ncbi:MAG: hypothetical protein SZ59_C0001G0047 [candidate division TM6 bacterium GW2011_GWF2_28_16]|nr:MAG: hypothetical protein SZ59_C0001G0047 [candidate division TM6 bacterium GW2011_GWF2_28_16]
MNIINKKIIIFVFGLMIAGLVNSKGDIKLRESYIKLVETNKVLIDQVNTLKKRRNQIKGDLGVAINAYQKDQTYKITPEDKVKLTESNQLKKQIITLSNQIKNNKTIISLLKADIFENLPISEKIKAKLEKFKAINDSGRIRVLDKIISSLNEQEISMNELQVNYIKDLINIAVNSFNKDIAAKAIELQKKLIEFAQKKAFRSKEEVADSRLEKFKQLSDNGKIKVLEKLVKSLDGVDDFIDVQMNYINSIIEMVSNSTNSDIVGYAEVLKNKLAEINQEKEEIITQVDVANSKIEQFNTLSNEGKIKVLEKMLAELDGVSSLDDMQINYINSIVRVANYTNDIAVQEKAFELKHKLSVKDWINEFSQLLQEKRLLDVEIVNKKIKKFSSISDEGKIIVLDSIINQIENSENFLNEIQVNYINNLVKTANDTNNKYVQNKALILLDRFNEYLQDMEELENKLAQSRKEEKQNKLNAKNYEEPLLTFAFDKEKINEYLDVYAQLKKDPEAKITLNTGKIIKINNYSCVDKPFDLNNTIIHDVLQFKPERIGDLLDIEKGLLCENSLIINNILFERIHFNDAVSFKGSKVIRTKGFNKALIFRNIVFKNGLDLSGLFIGNDVSLEFDKVTIYGNLNLNDLEFGSGSTLKINGNIIRKNYEHELMKLVKQIE